MPKGNDHTPRASHSPSPSSLPSEPLDVTIRKNYAQTKACFIVIKNLQVEVQQLRNEHIALRSAVLTLLSDPDAVREAAAVVKDFVIHKSNPK